MSDANEGSSAALFGFFERMPRQGPGAAAVTASLYRRARGLLPARPLAADMGCGSGAAGLVLARADARVRGVDVHAPFLRAFEAEAAAAGLGERVETLCASMLETGWPDACLDLIWSEGAVFTVGFDAALIEFSRMLKPGGVAVVSEASWLQDPALAPEELRAFWQAGYPDMRTVAGNLAAAEAAGWRIRHAELLADAVWEDEFYRPMEAVIADVEARDDPGLAVVAAECKAEIALFRRFSAWYGYVFYLLQRP